MSVHIHRDGVLWTVVIDRPARRNAVDGPTAAALADAFRAFEADPGARVAILTGAGGTFCSGADLTAFGTARANRVAPDGDGPMGPTRMALSKPVVAAISGYAVAGGLELALWCDLRVADSDAVLGVFCRRWGVPLVDGGTVRLPRLIGESRAMDLILTGRAVPAREAYDIGLINRLAPPGGALGAARELAAELARLPQECLRNDRAAVHAGTLADEHAYGVRSLATAAAAQGAARFAAGAGRHGGPAEPAQPTEPTQPTEPA
jgi:enoyl-CoA hydratase/carnithine racemase